jgi:hypothetical protein
MRVMAPDRRSDSPFDRYGRYATDLAAIAALSSALPDDIRGATFRVDMAAVAAQRVLMPYLPWREWLLV